MEREREIRAFIPVPFWVITADVKTKKNEQFTVTCTEEPKTEKEAERILKAAKSGSWSVKGLRNPNRRELRARPLRPQRSSRRRPRASASRPRGPMGIAQKLYEAGFITYMRTDSTNLAKEAQENILKAVRSEFGDKYAEARVYKTKSKSAQEAHEAVRPTDPSKRSLGHNEEQKKLYALIRARALASQMADAKIMRTKIRANVAKNGHGVSIIPDFAANGSRVMFDGWLAADPDARGEDVELPKAHQGDALMLVEARSEGKRLSRRADTPKRAW